MLAGSLEPLDPPKRLGKLTLLAKLGEGGMASVYLAAVGQRSLQRLAALKLLRQGVPDHDYRERFLDEARVVVRLHHNNLVDVREAGEVEGRLFITMELVEGRDLADLWDRCAELGKAFPVSLAVYVVREILRGLHYAHTFPRLALVHRDVSPSNILIGWSGAVKLADFGLATSSLKASMTVPGIVFGKVGYMSPEQARHESIDARADVYGCGAVLWELLTGRPLRDSGCDTTAVANFEAAPPSVHSRRVDEVLDAIVVRALAQDPDDRFPDAEKFMNALGEWLIRNAPDAGQEKMASFMTMLFGDAQQREHAVYQSMLDRASTALKTELLAHGAAARSQAPQQSREREQDEHIPAETVLVGRYRVLSRLGHGGMGTVYLAEHLTVGRSVAIKVLTREWSRNPAVAHRFRAEARAASAAGHPNIVDVFDAGTLEDGRLFLVMEFLTGRSLYEAVRDEGPMEPGQACRVVRDVAKAVRAAHRVGIIHRDLKPENVMLVDRSGVATVKVLDFGISVDMAQIADGERLTIAGQTLGTPEYMSPEQSAGADPSPAFDIYALGVMLYEVLVGEPPFAGDSGLEVMVRKASDPAPSLAAARPDLPRALVELVDDCLAIQVEDRPADMSAFIDRLQQALRAIPRDGDDEVVAADAGRMTVPMVPAGRGGVRATGWAMAAVAVVAAVGLAVWWMGDERQPELEHAAVMASEPSSAPALGEHGSTMPASPDNGETSSGTPLDETGPARQNQESSAIEPSVRPSPQPAPKDRRSPRAGPPTAQEQPASERPRCSRTRRAVREARQDGAWTTMLRHLSHQRCWADRSEHRRLRVLALKETHDFEACVAVGRVASGDAEIARMVEFCRARLRRERRQ